MIMWTDKLKRILLFILLQVAFNTALYAICVGDSLKLADDIGPVLIDITDSIVSYESKKGEIYEIPVNSVSFIDGDEHLKRFIYSNLENEYECNVRELFVIFFNKNLRIKEIRIVDISHHDCLCKKDYIQAIKKTEGMWMKNKQNLNNYLYIFSMHIH